MAFIWVSRSDRGARFEQRGLTPINAGQMRQSLTKNKLSMLCKQPSDVMLALPKGCFRQDAAVKKKKNRYTSSSQLRADQAPNAPWRDRLIYTDQTDVCKCALCRQM